MSIHVDYEDLAGAYARHRRVHPGVLRALIDGAGIARESRVVEVGCGTGNYLRAIVETTGCRGTGIDPAEAMLTRARRQNRRVAWVRGRAEVLPLADGSADLLFSVDVIHHVADRAAAFAEAMRVLAPGGTLCTATDSEEDIRRRRPLSSHFPETIAVELARYPAVATLHGELTAAGFADIRVEQVELAYLLTDPTPYRERTFSSLHLIPDETFARGLARLESEMAAGPIAALSLYTLVWARRDGGA